MVDVDSPPTLGHGVRQVGIDFAAVQRERATHAQYMAQQKHFMAALKCAKAEAPSENAPPPGYAPAYAYAARGGRHAHGSSGTDPFALYPQHQMHRTVSDIPTVIGNTVRSFSSHGQLSAAKGSSTTVSRSDIRLIQHLDSSALGLIRRWRLIGYFLILYYPIYPHMG
jgi:hypothetical protein